MSVQAAFSFVQYIQYLQALNITWMCLTSVTPRIPWPNLARVNIKPLDNGALM